MIYGKSITPHDLAFGKWVKEMGFGTRHMTDRHAAMEVAKLTPPAMVGVPTSITHPKGILKYLKDTATERSDDASAALRPDTKAVARLTPTTLVGVPVARLTPPIMGGVPVSMTHPHNIAFGKWVKEMGFDSRPQQHRHAAMEVSKLTPLTVSEVPISITHPQKILAFLKDTATERSDDASADPVLKESAEKYTKNPRGYHEESHTAIPPWPPRLS